MRKTLLMAATLFLLGSSPALAQNDALQLTDMSGESLDVNATVAAGKNVVLVFWQTWCGPCKREAPGLAEASLVHEKGLQFVGVVAGSDDAVNDKKVRKYLEKYKLLYPQIRDRDLSLVKRYEVKGTPTIIVLGEDLKVLYRGNHPPDSWDEFDLALSKGE